MLGMSRRPDDTTEPQPGSRPEPEREPRNYYYDDGTGYEVFDPTGEDDEPGAEPGGVRNEEGRG